MYLAIRSGAIKKKLSVRAYIMLIRLFHFVTLMMFSYYCSAQVQRSEATAMILSRGDTIWVMILSNGDLDLVFPAITESLGRPMIATPLWGVRMAFWKKVEVDWWPEPVTLRFIDKVAKGGDKRYGSLNPRNSKEKNEKLLAEFAGEENFRYLKIDVMTKNNNYRCIVSSSALKNKFESWFWNMIPAADLRESN